MTKERIIPIETKNLISTDTLGLRVAAFPAESGWERRQRYVMAWDHSLSFEENHRAAALVFFARHCPDMKAFPIGSAAMKDGRAIHLFRVNQ